MQGDSINGLNPLTPKFPLPNWLFDPMIIHLSNCVCLSEAKHGRVRAVRTAFTTMPLIRFMTTQELIWHVQRAPDSGCKIPKCGSKTIPYPKVMRLDPSNVKSIISQKGLSTNRLRPFSGSMNSLSPAGEGILPHPTICSTTTRTTCKSTNQAHTFLWHPQWDPEV